MIDEKNRLNELLRAENSLAQKYAVILCSAVSGDIRTKLTFNQRGINEAASFIIDETKVSVFPADILYRRYRRVNEKVRKGWYYYVCRKHKL